MNKSVCPQCHKNLDVSSEVNLFKGLGKCASCNIVFDLSDSGTYFKKNEYIDPSSIKVERSSRKTHIQFSWKKNYFILFFSFVWNSICFAVLGGILFSENSNFSISEMGPAVILLVTHPTVGFITLYLGLASLFNKTNIYIDSTSLKVFHSPLPWPLGKHELKKRDIEQLYVVTYISHQQNRRPIYRFKVVAITKNGPLDLIKGIGSYEKAVTLEVEIEKILRIRDEVVSEEHKVG